MDANDAAELLCLFKDGGSCSAAPSASLCVFKQTEPAVYSNTEFLESFHYWMFFVRLKVTVDPQVCSIRTHSVFLCLIQQEELLLSCVMDGGDRRWSGSTCDTISMTLVFNHMTSRLWLTRGVHLCLFSASSVSLSVKLDSLELLDKSEFPSRDEVDESSNLNHHILS